MDKENEFPVCKCIDCDLISPKNEFEWQKMYQTFLDRVCNKPVTLRCTRCGSTRVKLVAAKLIVTNENPRYN